MVDVSSMDSCSTHPPPRGHSYLLCLPRTHSHRVPCTGMAMFTVGYVNNRCQRKHKGKKNPFLLTLAFEWLEERERNKAGPQKKPPRKGLQEIRQTDSGGVLQDCSRQLSIHTCSIWPHGKGDFWMVYQVKLNCTPHSSELHFLPITRDQSTS